MLYPVLIMAFVFRTWLPSFSRGQDETEVLIQEQIANYLVWLPHGKFSLHGKCKAACCSLAEGHLSLE